MWREKNQSHVVVPPVSDSKFHMIMGLILIVLFVFILIVLFFKWRGKRGDTDDDRKRECDRMFELYNKFTGSPPELSYSEYHQLLRDQPVVLVDCRTKEEQAVSMLPDAITKEEFELKKEALKHSAIVCYCTIGMRSGRFVQQLLAQEFKNQPVFNLRGSVLGWIHHGLAVIDPETKKTVKKVHVYGKTWDLAPREYETVWF